MKLKLTDREWREFRVGDLFLIEKCKCNNASVLNDGDFPYIGATNSNNGIMRFVEKNNKLITNGDCIVFVSDGQGSCGYSFYKESDFIGSTTLKVGRNLNLNKYTGRFISTALDMNKEIYSYGYKRKESRLKKEVIKLPITSEFKPDWDFMEQYIRELEMEKLQEYREYVESVIEELEYVEIPELSEKEWGSFNLSGKSGVLIIESTKSGIDKNKLKIEEAGLIPYITRTDLENGINMFVGKDQGANYKINEGNVITLGLDTQTVFYQEHKFFTGQNIQVINCDRLNKYVALFLIPSIKIQMDKFNWGGNGATLGRLAKTKFMIPVNSEGKPDFEYMEQYVKNQMITKYKKYLEFKK